MDETNLGVPYMSSHNYDCDGLTNTEKYQVCVYVQEVRL